MKIFGQILFLCANFTNHVQGCCMSDIRVFGMPVHEKIF